MEKALKTEVIKSMNAAFSSAGAMVVTHYKGLTVAQITDLRSKARKAGASFKVTKNTLAKRAMEGTPYAPLQKLMTGPTAIAYSPDPVAAAKAVAEFAKDNEKLVIIGGAFGDKLLDAKGVETLSKMPSLDELRGKIIGLLQAPATKIAGVLQAPAGQLARVVGAYASKG